MAAYYVKFPTIRSIS